MLETLLVVRENRERKPQRTVVLTLRVSSELPDISTPKAFRGPCDQQSRALPAFSSHATRTFPFRPFQAHRTAMVLVANSNFANPTELSSSVKVWKRGH